MKKIILIVFAFQLYIVQSFGQCTPDTSYKAPGYYPSELPDALVGQAYTGVITVVVPKDTTVDIGFGPMTFDIDSAGITDLTGLPTGFTYATNTASGYWHGGVTGCIAITGTATQDQIGDYMLTGNFDIYAAGMSYQEADSSFTLSVVDNPNGIISMNKHADFILLNNYPDPASTYTNITFFAPDKGQYSLQVFDVLGNVVFQKNIISTQVKNVVHINVSQWNAGLYFYSVSGTDKSLTGKMMIVR